MDQSFLDSVLRATKDYWFLITLVASVLLTLAYMIIFRVNPWDQHRSVKLRRDRVRFHNSVGYTLLEAGHFTDARNEFEEALKLSAEDQTALNGKYLSNLFINIDTPTADPAIGFAIHRHITQTDDLRRDEHRHIIDKYLGDLHRRVLKIPEAIAYYESALKRKPDYPNALYTLGWQYYQGAYSNIDGMERMFRRMTEIDPHNYRGYHGLGYALYMKGLSELDRDVRSSIIDEAARQSGLAKDLSFTQLNIVMDFGEVARSVDPWLSLFFHDEGKKILKDPDLRNLGENPLPLYARMLKSDLEFTIDGKEQKLSWIAYQKALDYLAMQRKHGDPQYGLEHQRFYEQARRLDPDERIRNVYVDQLAILDMLLPAEFDGS